MLDTTDHELRGGFKRAEQEPVRLTKSTPPNTGWVCPLCRVSNAPTVRQCPCSSAIRP